MSGRTVLFRTFFALLLVTGTIPACDPGPGTGAAAVSITYRSPQAAGLRGLLSGVVDTVRVEVRDAGGALVQQAFDYEGLAGEVTGIPAGTGRDFLVEATSSGEVVYRGVQQGITVVADETVNVSVEMSPAYLDDVYAPAQVADLAAQANGQDVDLTWTATGDDGLVGRASSYDLRWSEANITANNFDSATAIAGTPAPGVAGTAEAFSVSGMTPGVPIHFAIRVLDDDGNRSAVSEEAIATVQSGDDVAPADVMDLAVDSFDDSSVTLTWTAPGDDGAAGTAAQYEIYYHTASFNDFQVATAWASPPVPQAAGSAETVTITGLTAGTEYFFRIRAGDEVPNWAPLSNEVSATPEDVIAPSAVSLSVSAVTDTSVTLEWLAPGDDADQGTAASYEIRYMDEGTGVIDAANFDTATLFDSPPAPQAAGSTETVEITGLTTGTQYSFGLVSTDDAGNPSDLSNVPLATPGEQDDIPPDDVLDLAVAGATDTTVSLTWTAPGDDGAAGNPVAAYDVRYAATEIVDQAAFDLATPFAWPGGTDIVAAGTQQTLDVTGLTQEQTYYFALRARDEFSNWSGVSNSPSATTVDLTAPADVVDLAVDSVSETSVFMSWTAPGDDGAAGSVASYDVRFATTQIVDDADFTAATPFAWPGGLAIEAGGDPQTLEVTGLTTGQAYWFAIKASDDGGNESGLSNVVTDTPEDMVAPAAVVDLSVDAVTDDSATLGWTAPGDDADVGTADSYEIRYSDAAIDAGNFASATLFNSPPAPQAAGSAESVVIDTLALGTTYYFALIAYDEAGNPSALSNVPIGTPGEQDVTAPADVADLAVGSVTDTSVLLSWTAPGDDGAAGTVTSYDVRYAAAEIVDDAAFTAATPFAWPGGLAIETGGTTQTLEVTGLTQDTTYFFAVKAADNSGNESGVSNSPSGTPADLIAPEAIADLAVGGSSATSVTLNWTAPGDDADQGTASAYEVRYSTSAIDAGNFDSATLFASPPSPPAAAGQPETVTVDGLTTATDYWFAVKAVDEAGNWALISNVVTATTP